MAVGTLTAPSVGDQITAAFAQTVVSDINLLLAPTVFEATSTATQSFVNGTNTTTIFDTETIDIYGGHSNTVNPTRYTVPAALNGYRLVVLGVVQWAPSATGAREAWVYKNSAIVVNSFVSGSNNGGGSFPGLASGGTSMIVATGDIIEIGGVQVSGGALSTLTLACRFNITFGGLS